MWRAGEDYPCSGRLLLFEVTKDEAAPQGQPKWKATMVYVRHGAAAPCARAVSWARALAPAAVAQPCGRGTA